MLLKGARAITYGATLTAFGVIMVLISVYTPFGRRVLFLSSGLPVLIAARLWNWRWATAVFGATGLLLLLAVHPLKGVGYFLLSGGVALLQSAALPLWALGIVTFLLSLIYLGLALFVLGLDLDAVLAPVTVLLPWVEPKPAALAAVLALSFLYPWFLRLVAREIESHWLYKSIFKP